MKILAGCACLALSLPTVAQEPNSLTGAEKKAGWKLLFDGKSLEGWMSWNTRKPLEEGAGWAIEDGALCIVGRRGTSIYTKEAFEHFELSLEWKTTGNSGILFRVDPSAKKGKIWYSAPEVQILKDDPKSLKSTSSGGLYQLYDIGKGKKVYHPDGWNHLRIRLVDNRGTHWLNGQELYSYEIGSEDWNQRFAKSKFRKFKGFAKLAKGHIGLQYHGAKVRFRNVKIRILSKGDR